MSRTRSLPCAAVVALVALVALAVASPARAQEPGEDRQAAAREFQEGQRAYAAGDYRLSAEQFEAAYKHKPHFASLWNAARARQRAGDNARAANLYARYLREAPPSARDRNTAQAALRELAQKLGRLEITAVGLEDTRLDGEPAPDRTVYVNPGVHVVEANKRGEGGEKVVRASPSVEAGQTVSVALVPPNVGEVTVGPAVTTPPPPPPPPPPPKAKEKQGWSPIVVAVGGGLTALAAVGTLASGLDTLSQRTEFDKDPSQGNLDRGKSKELRTNVLLAVTGTLAILTGACAIWLVDWRGTNRAVQVGAGPGEVRFRAEF